MANSPIAQGFRFHSGKNPRYRGTGIEDEKVFEIARDKKAVLVTYDRGFGNTRKYQLHHHSGIIILKVYSSKSLQRCHKVLQKLLETENNFKGALLIVDENNYRKRKAR